MLTPWANRWGIAPAAVAELRAMMGVAATPQLGPTAEGSEASVQNAIRLEAARRGARLFRNNSGAYQDERGNFIRYGLMNESKSVNSVCKSSDLIGISNIGQFLAYEVKRPGWHFTATPREVAQQNFLNLIVSLGGRAKFITSVQELDI